MTWDQNVTVGGVKKGQGVVKVMNTNGKHLVTYEKDNDKPIFTYPRRITTRRNGNIFIEDWDKVVVIKLSGSITFYNGHPDINSDDCHFRPVAILVTFKDNVLIRNSDNDHLHILTNKGEFISNYNMTNIGIIRPYFLALLHSGTIYVGSASSKDDPPDT